MKNFTISLCISFLLNLNATAQSLSWAKSMGGATIERGYSVALDNLYNVYTCGIYAGTVDFDPGPAVSNLTSLGGSAAFITKFDSAGNFIWAKSISGIDGVQARSVAVDPFNNIIVCGSFAGTVDFDPGNGITNLTAVGLSSTFIVKIDNIGNFDWVASFEGLSSNEGWKVCSDPLGNILATGRYNNTVDFDPGPGIYNLTPVGSVDVFVTKLNPSGFFVWAKSLGGNGSELGFSVTADNNGNIYTTGYFQQTADFDPGPAVFNLVGTGTFDIFVSKLNNSGDFVWAKAFLGVDNSQGYSVAVDNAGNVYSTGVFRGTVDFDPNVATYNLVSAGSTDIFVSKLDSTGNLVWAKSVGSTAGDEARSIVTDTTGNLYLCGFYSLTTDFDPGPGTFNMTSAGGGDLYVMKLNAAGNFVWAKSMGGTNESDAYDLFLDPERNIYITGSFQDTVDFDPNAGIFNLVSAGGPDIYVVKLAQCVLHTPLNVPACDSYTLNGQTYTASGVYTQSMVTALGCDSIITLNLTITTVDTSITQTGFTLSSNATPATYQWIRCNPFSIIAGATNQAYTVSSNGSYAVIVTQNGCTDTSSCYNYTGLGSDEFQTANLISVSPNPSNGKFIFDLGEISDGQIQIYNLLGELMQEINIYTSKTEVNLELANGLYYYKIVGNKLQNTGGKLLLRKD